MKFLYALVPLALIFVTALSAGIYDLDNTAVLRDLESDGLYFEGRGSTERLKISSSGGSTSFYWWVDRDSCRGILDIISGTIFVSSG